MIDTKWVYIIALIILCLLGVNVYSQKPNPQYNKALADSLGGDDYGMKKYVLVILKTGPNDVQNKSERDSLFRGHMNNMNRLVTAGKLIVAGPLQKNEKNFRGIFILNAASIEEARPLLETDPAIKAKLFDTELFVWYGSAALPVYLPVHDKIEKNKH